MTNRYNTIAKVAPRPLWNPIATLTIVSPDDTTCIIAETYYALEGTFTDGRLVDFTLDENTGIITYIGSGGEFVFHGTSDLQADKVCRITYAMALNGVIQTGVTTPVDILSANKSGNISINRPITLVTNDTIQVKMKSDTANTVVTVNSLNLVIRGDTTYK
ncbi:hypothetical protein KAR91_79755 [Candidatus Pacearchaeota archaeon]|nr:hypothetical protein [Candidatus Pacearchaeota archaeon]